jgi:RNase H-fold protein (predicted Holliday junction resolvase)
MKRKPERKQRILGLDVRSRRIGYAVFEHPTRLVDFGVTRFKSNDAAVVRLATLIRNTQPDVLVLLKISSKSSRNRHGTRAIQRAARLLGGYSSIEVAFISEAKLRSCFREKGTNTKYQMASHLAQVFPELGWRLPLPRKPWETEYRNMSIFDAAALGITYLACAKDMKQHPRAHEQSSFAGLQ